MTVLPLYMLSVQVAWDPFLLMFPRLYASRVDLFLEPNRLGNNFVMGPFNVGRHAQMIPIEDSSWVQRKALLVEITSRQLSDGNLKEMSVLTGHIGLSCLGSWIQSYHSHDTCNNHTERSQCQPNRGNTRLLTKLQVQTLLAQQTFGSYPSGEIE